MTQHPFFSIVIPVYNREELILRALRSCLEQEGDFEVIVVDDRSADGTVSAVRSIRDPRIRLVSHDRNRGVGSARNSGFQVSRGEWIICLDSDDELLPGAIAVMTRRAAEAGDRVDVMRFMVRTDTGLIAPDPPLNGAVWNYESYLRWANEAYGRREETLPVVRRRTFETIRYSEERALESLYHLDLAKSFQTLVCADVLRLYHQDATNQLTRDGHELLRSAADQASQTEELLSRHGDALACYAPRMYRKIVAGLSTMHFLAGHRKAGLRASLRSLRIQPFSYKQWGVLVGGLFGPWTLLHLRSLGNSA